MSAGRPARPGSLSRREAIRGYAYISPWLAGFVVFTLGPILASAYLSLTNYQILAPPRFVGLANYARALGSDEVFWRAVYNTTYYAAIFVPTSIAGSLLAALLLNARVRGQAAFRTMFCIPSITPAVASILIWIWGAVGGSTMIIFLAGLQGIPAELHEASRIDGANGWQEFVNVTLPMPSPALFFNLIVGLIGAFRVFTAAFVATGGGPMYSTMFYMLYLFNNAFLYPHMGFASALAWLFVALVFVLVVIQVWMARRWVYYEGGEK